MDRNTIAFAFGGLGAMALLLWCTKQKRPAILPWDEGIGRTTTKALARETAKRAVAIIVIVLTTTHAVRRGKLELLHAIADADDAVAAGFVSFVFVFVFVLVFVFATAVQYHLQQNKTELAHTLHYQV